MRAQKPFAFIETEWAAAVLRPRNAGKRDLCETLTARFRSGGNYVFLAGSVYRKKKTKSKVDDVRCGFRG